MLPRETNSRSRLPCCLMIKLVNFLCSSQTFGDWVVPNARLITKSIELWNKKLEKPWKKSSDRWDMRRHSIYESIKFLHATHGLHQLVCCYCWLSKKSSAWVELWLGTRQNESLQGWFPRRMHREHMVGRLCVCAILSNLLTKISK